MDSKENELEEEDIQQINKAVNKYYQLKMKYESNINSLKKQISIAYTSTRERRNQFIASKIKCINCGRPVKSIFQTTYNKTSGSRSLIAKCGDILEHCSLNININMGYCEMLPDSITMYETLLSKLKNDIIKEKNDTLFGYTTNTEAISNFEKMKVNVSEYTETLETYYYLYLNTKVNKEEITTVQNKIYGMINAIKEEIKADNPENAVQMYLSDLKPALSKLMSLKYRMNIVEYDDKSDIYTLIQRENTPQDFEQLYGEPKIISYKEDEDTGLEVKKDKGKKRAKKEGAPEKPKKERASKKERATEKPKKERAKKERAPKKVELRVNDEPIDFGDSDEEDEDAKQAQEERDIEQEH